MVLAPDANQGPMLGIFITGPGGASLGAILGLAVAALGVTPGSHGGNEVAEASG
jgi:hypothetical protein